MDPKLLLLKHFEKLVLGLFVGWLLYTATGLLGTPPALEAASGIGTDMKAVQTYIENDTSLKPAKGPGWKADLEQKLDPSAIPTAAPWATWLSHRRPGIVYYVEVIDKNFTARHEGAVDVTGDTSQQGKIQLNWGVGETRYVTASYEVHRSVDQKDEWEKIGETEELTFVDDKISTRLSYVYKIVSIAILDKTHPVFSDSEANVSLPDEIKRVESGEVGPFATQREVQIIPVSTKPMTEDIEVRDPDFKESCNIIVRKLINGKWEEKSFYRKFVGDELGEVKGRMDYTTGAKLKDVLEDEITEGSLKSVKVIQIEWPDGQTEIVKSDDPKLGVE